MDGQLIQFRTQNHRSLRDEQMLSFVTSGVDEPRLLHPNGIDETLVPVAAIYGANASGKSNVLDALAFAGRAVVLSQRAWQPDEGVSRQPFALGPASNAPSLYVVQVMLRGVRHEYGFAVNDSEVVEEWLHVWPLGRKQELFSRDHQTFDFGRNLPGENKAIEALTRPNSLFLSAAAQNNHEHLAPLFQWFSMRLRIEGLDQPFAFGFVGSRSNQWWSQFTGQGVQGVLFEEEGRLEAIDRRREQVRALLASADLGIDNFRVEEEQPPMARRASTTEARMGVRGRLSFSHKAVERSEGAWLELDQESTGTQALVRLLPGVVRVLEGGGVLAIDELNSLHPMLALAIVRLFQDPARNIQGAQLLFNTHEASLLGNLLCDPPPLRRDQVWLTEKDDEGATHLYPLTDYKPRSAENLERGYLQGRYGAVPFVGSLEWTTLPNEVEK